MTPTTELEAVNTMLSYMGESPVSTIKDTEVAEAQQAVASLREVSREIQANGTCFNTERRTFLPEVPTGYIRLSQSMIRAIPDRTDIVARGQYLYNLTEATKVFTEPVEATVVIALDYDELPEEARYYILVRAARKFLARILGSEELVGLSERDEYEARRNFLEFERDQTRPNIFTLRDRAKIARIEPFHGSPWL